MTLILRFDFLTFFSSHNMQLVKTLIPILWFLIIALGHKVSGLGVLGTALTSNELDIDNHLCKAENIKVNEYFCSSGWQRITKGQSIWPNPKVFIFWPLYIFGSFPAESVDSVSILLFRHGLWRPGEEIAFTEQPTIHSHWYLPLPNIKIRPKHILSATSAQIFRFL